MKDIPVYMTEKQIKYLQKLLEKNSNCTDYEDIKPHSYLTELFADLIQLNGWERPDRKGNDL